MAKLLCVVLVVFVCSSYVMGSLYLRRNRAFLRPSLLEASASSSASANVHSSGRRGLSSANADSSASASVLSNDRRGLGSANADSSSSASASSIGGRGQASADSQSSASATLSRNDCLENECYEGDENCYCYDTDYCYSCTYVYDNVLRPSRRRLNRPFFRQRTRGNLFNRLARNQRRRGYPW